MTSTEENSAPVTNTTPSKKRSQVNADTVSTIKMLFEQNMSKSKIATTTGLCRSTIYKVLRNLGLVERMPEGRFPKRSPRPKEPGLDSINTKLIEFIRENCTMKQKEMQERLAQDGIEISQAAISRRLKDMNIPRMKVKRKTIYGNDVENGDAYIYDLGNQQYETDPLEQIVTQILEQ